MFGSDVRRYSISKYSSYPKISRNIVRHLAEVLDNDMNPILPLIKVIGLHPLRSPNERWHNSRFHKKV